eukprot:Phypoly_transcript_00949.p1 GENE.Phypoly_transcript_00949~~Phypoly_transcript_00949.p1  ORF type:complete len:1118 (+),score=84.56 Phypoly_transcript_00949:49-3402(+)
MAVTLDNLRNVHQTLLVSLLESIFPGEQIYVNTKKKTSLKYPQTGAYIEFDVWVPLHNLCFEFQDAYHYVTTWYYHNAQAHIQQKDYMKVLLAREKGMTLITVPCWWNGNAESLLSTILFHSPEITTSRVGARPISLNPLSAHINSLWIPTVGELMLASFPTDPNFTLSIDAADNWWMGEKYDGIRCCWHAENKTVYSRQGKELTLSPHLMAYLPSVFVDGELWFGRGTFSSSYVMVKGVTDIVPWHSLRMISFDNPAPPFQFMAFEHRYHALLDHIPSDHAFNIIVARLKCKNLASISKTVQAIIDEEGEGVILRRCGSKYEHGRNSDLIKLKAAQGDQEGIVVGIGNDKSIEVKLPSGKTFTVPPSHVQVPSLAIGDVVSFSYESGARRELPVNPQIYRVRTDIEWEDVVESAANEQRFLNDSSAVPGFTSHPLYHWNLKNMRSLLESLAKNKSMDPLSPETWYNLNSSAIRELKGGHAVLKKFSGYFETVETLFPELGLDLSTYKQYTWDDEEKRRRFFENYARANDFDPLVPDHWYAQPKDKMMSYKGATEVLVYYNRSVPAALIALFPDIGLKSSMFYWPTWIHSVAKTFFMNYANENEFDPLKADNWHQQPHERILEYKGAMAALLPYNGSPRKALAAVFPDIGFDKARFSSAAFSAPENRRSFFIEYALSHKFDPNIPENWYNQSFSNIIATEGASKVMSYHSGSVARALLDLFPDIGLVKQKFYYKSIWSFAWNRREFFQDYARQNGFDPKDVNKWYIQPKERILNCKGASRILCYHQNSISKALMDLFPNYGFVKSKFLLTPIWQDIKNRRRFFEDYARDKGFDPLHSGEWYTRADDILATKGVRKLLFYHSDSVSKALIDLFPDIGLDKKMFNARYRVDEIANRKKFFETFAHINKFDPIVANNWYSQSRSKIMAFQGATRVMAFYSNSISKALIDLFPNIGLDEAQFLLKEMHHASNRRRFFENFAKKHGFDPYVAENWYAQSRKKILSTPGIEVVLRHHKNNTKRALLDLFPSIGLDISKFQFRVSPWSEIENRRKFFEAYAEEASFDPKDAASWHIQAPTKLMSRKGASRVIVYHNNNILQALYDLFPNIGLDPLKLHLPHQIV